METESLKEITNDLLPIRSMTNLLTPRRPYLYLNQQTGTFHVLYWVAWFATPDGTYRPNAQWNGSDWYDDLPTRRYDQFNPSKKWNDWPKRGRIWELPGIQYDEPKVYTDGKITFTEKDLEEIIDERLEKLQDFRSEDTWIDPHCPNMTNGYNRAVDEEINFLKSLRERYKHENK